MSPTEILADFVKGVNKKFSYIYQSNTMYCDIGLDRLPRKDIEYAHLGDLIGLCRLYEHKEVATRQYRDEGCAVYKLIRYVEKGLKDKTDKLFWRFKPEVTDSTDFGSWYPTFSGYARFSVF